MGMDMPISCAECDAEGHYENSYGDEFGFFCPFGYKAYTSETRDAKRLDNCPLVELPPHGRLIDADALKVFYEKWHDDEQLGVDIDKCYVPVPVVRLNIDDAPTIIPADEPTQFNTSNTLDALGEEDE